MSPLEIKGTQGSQPPSSLAVNRPGIPQAHTLKLVTLQIWAGREGLKEALRSIWVLLALDLGFDGHRKGLQTSQELGFEEQKRQNKPTGLLPRESWLTLELSTPSPSSLSLRGSRVFIRKEWTNLGEQNSQCGTQPQVTYPLECEALGTSGKERLSSILPSFKVVNQAKTRMNTEWGKCPAF